MSGFIDELFARAVANHPDAVAVEGSTKSLTFAQLDELTDRWARVMLDRGVGPESRVGICAPVTPDTIAAVVAVFKSGAAFVPIDPSYPADRVAAIVETCHPDLLLVRETLHDWRPLGSGPRLPLKALAAAGAEAARAGRPVRAPEHAAYVVFTSGSTGRPKGVVVQHSGLRNMIEQQIEAFGIVPGSRVLQFASFSFDASVSEIFTALCGGGTLCVIEQAKDRQGAAVLDLIERKRISVVTLPPSLLRALPGRDLPELRTLVSAGEACSAEVVERWRRPGRRLINAYGPSEATVCATMNTLAEPSDATKLGPHLRGLDTHVLAGDVSPVAAGEIGELYLSGIGLARGYLGPAALTAERFVPDRLGPPGARMYRTGDRVRVLADGALEFLGRTDHQVKVRGFRIEPAEVEAALRTAPGVRDVLVAPRQRASGDALLVAYVLGVAELEPALRVHARRALADFMQPSEYVFVDEWPRTPAGKVDRERLAATGRNRTAAATPRPPASGTEGVLVRLYEELLELHPIDPSASFFDLGGDSILALRLLLRIEIDLGRRIGFAALFEMPSASVLASWIDRSKGPAPPCRALLLRPGTGTPLWLVPPVHGNPLCYLELARRAHPGVPLYSVQIPGLADDREPLDSLEALASVLVGQIRDVQPHGPYWLGGWSFGGALALATALQLQAQGERIGGLLLIAATPPSLDHLLVARQIMGDYPVWKMCFMYASQMAHSIGQRLDLVAEYAAFRDLDAEAACKLLTARLALIGTVPTDASLDEMRRWVRVFRASLYAFHYYEVPAAYRGRALVLSPLHPNPVHHSPMVDRPLPPGSWNHILDDGFEVVKIDGDPLNLMARPWVDGVIDVIESWIARG
jgi:amino acid adenylation domain-containing protein